MLVWQTRRRSTRFAPGFGLLPGRSRASRAVRRAGHSRSRSTRTPCGGRSTTAARWRCRFPSGRSRTPCASSSAPPGTWNAPSRPRARRSRSGCRSASRPTPPTPSTAWSSSWATSPGRWAAGSPSWRPRPARLARKLASRLRPTCWPVRCPRSAHGTAGLRQARELPWGSTPRRPYAMPWSGPLLPRNDPRFR